MKRQVTWAQIGQGTWTDKGSRRLKLVRVSDSDSKYKKKQHVFNELRSGGARKAPRLSLGPCGVPERIGVVPGVTGGLGRSHARPWSLLNGLGGALGPCLAFLAVPKNIEHPIVFVASPVRGASVGDLGANAAGKIGQAPWTDKRIGPNWTSDLDRQVLKASDACPLK